MEALAVHLMWIAAATYCALLAPKTLLATLIGVLGMAHFSLGMNNLISICKSFSVSIINGFFFFLRTHRKEFTSVNLFVVKLCLIKRKGVNMAFVCVYIYIDYYFSRCYRFIYFCFI